MVSEINTIETTATPLLVWSLFTAAYTTDSSIRNSIIDQIWNRISSNTTDTGIFSTAYKLDSTGAAIKNLARFCPFSLPY